MKTIEKEELREKLKNDEIILIEVLDEEQYNREHIKGAINIPLKKIATEANQKFEKDDAIAVYCSDYECTSSPTAAKKLD
ncbi:MAG: rhodanese-like domain-containing protein, partial [Bacteroidales bacterium]